MSRAFSLNFAVSLLISGLRHFQKIRAPNGMQCPGKLSPNRISCAVFSACSSLRAATPADGRT
eukprot:8591205-Pyramimonas_sp.AAC.1